MKENIKKIKEIWSVPRYHALIELFLYLIFFVIVAIIIRSATSSNDVVYQSALDKFNNMKSFNYECNISKKVNNVTNTYNVIGSLNYKNTFTYLNTNYEIIDGSIMKDGSISNIKLDFDLFYITHTNLYTEINSNKLYSKTSFEDGTISKTYRIFKNNKYIDITTYELNDLIFKVIIDYNDTLLNIEDYVIEISYSNIE